MIATFALGDPDAISARSNLADQCTSDEPKPRRHPPRDDERLVAMIRKVIDERGSYG